MIELVMVLMALGFAFATSAVYWWAEAPRRRWPVWLPALQAAAFVCTALSFGLRLGALFETLVGIAAALAIAIAIAVGLIRRRRMDPRV